MYLYEQNLLHARVNSWIGAVFLVTVALWASLVIWRAATGDNFVVQAFAAAVERHTVLK